MLQIQVHIKLPKPVAGIEYTRALLDEIANRWINYEKIPNGVKVTALSWRTKRSQDFTKEARPAKIESARAAFSQVGGFVASSV
jgi:hypothetical protein